MNRIIYWSICIVLLGISIAYFELLKIESFYITSFGFQENDLPPLVIAVLTARSNFRKRESIRNTWGKTVSKWKYMVLKFFIGQECQVPIMDRLDELDCNESKQHCSGNVLTLRRKKEASHEFSKSCYIGFGFKVIHPLVLNAIGVHLSLLEDNEELHVTFQDPEEVFENIIFHNPTCFSIKDDYCFMNLEEKIMLPKYFEGEISISLNKKRKEKSLACSLGDYSCIRFLYGMTEIGYEKVKENRCSFVIAKFSLQDVESLLKFTKEKTKRQSEWLQAHENMEAQIKLENDIHSDLILLPDVVDVYRNLPLKVLEALKWVNKNYPGSAVLKVDDDSMVNVSLLSKTDSEWFEEKPLSLWSHFYYNRAVPRFGKWADSDFNGMTYPSFPSGSGYLLSGRLVTLLSQMSPFLRAFQGEDVSVGIWTEFLKMKNELVRKVHMECWLPSAECSYSYIIPELTVEQMILFNS